MRFSIILLLLATGLATPPAWSAPGSAPSGFQWNLSNTVTYTVSLSDSRDLGVDGNVNGGAGLSTLGETLSLTTFNASSAPANTHYCVTSSNYSVGLTADASATVFNFTPAADDFSGIVSLSNFTIGLDGTAGPSTSSLVRSTAPLSVPAFGLDQFSDQTSAATAASFSLSDTGTAPTDGTDMAFSFTGTMAAFVTSGSKLGDGSQFYGAPSVARYDARITTLYDVYTLVAIPEPSTGLLMLLSCPLLLRRCRRYT